MVLSFLFCFIHRVAHGAEMRSNPQKPRVSAAGQYVVRQGGATQEQAFA
jgi:hypothetical protein